MCGDALDDGRLPHYVRFHCDVCSGIVRARDSRVLYYVRPIRDDANVPRILTIVQAFNAFNEVIVGVLYFTFKILFEFKSNVFQKGKINILRIYVI